MTAPTDADIAAMPGIADAALARTFHWPLSEEARLYRDCPTAFWLAPDADDVLTERPAPPPPASAPAALADVDTTATGFLTAIGLALLVAGPSFVATMGLVTDIGGTTPITRIAMGVAMGLVLSPLTIPFGGIAAATPVILGVSLLAWLGTTYPAARRRRVWAATGAGMGLIIAAAFDAGMTTLPLVLTSIACASIAHTAIDWTTRDPA